MLPMTANTAATGARTLTRILVDLFIGFLLSFGGRDTCDAGASALLAGLATGSPLSAMRWEVWTIAATWRSSEARGRAGTASCRSSTNPTMSCQSSARHAIPDHNHLCASLVQT